VTDAAFTDAVPQCRADKRAWRWRRTSPAVELDSEAGLVERGGVEAAVLGDGLAEQLRVEHRHDLLRGRVQRQKFRTGRMRVKTKWSL
jgi:hypothetical protein